MHRVSWHLLIAVGLLSPLSRAAVIYHVSITTSPLVDHPAGPFYFEVQFNDGSGAGDGNNVATLAAFDFGAGSPSGDPTRSGDVSGDLGSSITLTDTKFFNQFIQNFNPGKTLNFDLSLTTNVDSGVPDEFSLAILDSSGVEIPTLDAANVLIVIDIDSAIPSVTTFPTDPSQSPNAGGPPISIASPTIVSSIPEPRTACLFGTGIVITVLLRCKRR